MNEIIATVLRASVHRFIGRLGRDPEIRYFESGNCVANATMAINKPGAKKDDGQEPDWFKIEIWGEAASQFVDQCKKGALVDVTGRVKTDRWTDRNTGEQKTQLVVTAEMWSIVPMQPKPAPSAASAPAPAPAPAAAPPAVVQQAAQQVATAFNGVVTDFNAEIPF
jgi:single-strand DNA-binding protein